MASLFTRIRSFFRELRRRNVYRVAGAYLVAGFVAVQIAELAAGAFGLPGWFEPMIWVCVGLGFPIALVLVWALEVTPEGVQATSEAEESGTETEASSSRLGLLVGISTIVVVFGLGGAWWLNTGDPPGEPAGSTPAQPAETERSVAVLPFEVTGEASADWGDGMVTMLSTGLDGAAGLRAISDRRVFAVWEAVDTTVTDPAADPALETARRLEAAFAVTGSAVTLGDELQLVAEIWETASGKRLGQVEVTGRPDEITALADKLTRRAIGTLAGETEAGTSRYADLASVTTSSVSALKRYLAGERRFRNGQYEGAAEKYRAAIEEDSTFALAYLRLNQTLGWSQGEGAAQALQQAYHRSDQLPRREARLIRARYLRDHEGAWLTARDSLRRLTRAYPDDPSMWYELGEVLFHAWISGGWPAADQAFQEAVALDPNVAPYHHHLVHLAMIVHRDSALAARRLAAAPKGPVKEAQQIGFTVLFGRPADLDDALSQRKGPEGRLSVWALDSNLLHPEDLALRDRLLQHLNERDDLLRNARSYTDYHLVLNAFHRGRIQEALRRYRREEPLTVDLNIPLPPGPCQPLQARSLGLPVPDSTVQALTHSVLTSETAPPKELMCAGFALIELGWTEELPALIDRLRERGTAQEVAEGEITRTVEEIRGYQAFRAGELKKAAQYWASSNESYQPGALLRGDLHRKLGKLDQAEGWYHAAWPHPLAHERLGQLYEQMNRPEEAAAAYQRFIEAWKNADPALQPRVDKAREWLRTLTSEPGRMSS